jgi:hypothetical protein
MGLCTTNGARLMHGVMTSSDASVPAELVMQDLEVAVTLVRQALAAAGG